MAYVNALVEGAVDEAVSTRLIAETGHVIGTVYGKRGFGYVREKIAAFNNSAHTVRYLALVDLMDTPFTCPPDVVSNWLPHPKGGMLFRVVVREIESWIMADRDGIAEFLGIRSTKVPSNPELESDPKQTLVNLARRSRRKSVRDELVPRPGSTAATGRLYSSALSRFVQTNWNVAKARACSPSLDRCMARLAALPHE